MKRQITLKECHDLIENASAIIVNDDVLSYPSMEELTGDPTNVWLYITWEYECQDFEVKFTEKDQEIMFDGSTITMCDSVNELVDLTLLVQMK